MVFGPFRLSADVMLTITAFLDVPMMGKLMFQINGKPHGRNQLIALYMWIAYEKSLPPNVRPDKTKRRTQKQVSSHIQVLKGYIRTDPACKYPWLLGPFLELTRPSPAYISLCG